MPLNQLFSVNFSCLQLGTPHAFYCSSNRFIFPFSSSTFIKSGRSIGVWFGQCKVSLRLPSNVLNNMPCPPSSLKEGTTRVSTDPLRHLSENGKPPKRTYHSRNWTTTSLTFSGRHKETDRLARNSLGPIFSWDDRKGSSKEPPKREKGAGAFLTSLSSFNSISRHKSLRPLLVPIHGKKSSKAVLVDRQKTFHPKHPSLSEYRPFTVWLKRSHRACLQPVSRSSPFIVFRKKEANI